MFIVEDMTNIMPLYIISYLDIVAMVAKYPSDKHCKNSQKTQVQGFGMRIERSLKTNIVFFGKEIIKIII